MTVLQVIVRTICELRRLVRSIEMSQCGGTWCDVALRCDIPQRKYVLNLIEPEGWIVRAEYRQVQRDYGSKWLWNRLRSKLFLPSVHGGQQEGDQVSVLVRVTK